MLATRKQDFKGKIVAVSASGNVAQYTVEKVNQLGGKVITLSDSDGTIVDEAGVDQAKLAFVLDLKNNRRGRIKEYADKYKAVYIPGKSVWDVIREKGIHVDMAFPSACQNEIDMTNAEALVKNGCFCVSEGANMPSTLEAIQVYQENNVLYGPAKAANAGGVATSGLEMSQNSMRLSWTREEVDATTAWDHEEHPQGVPGRRPKPTARRATIWSAPISRASSRWPTPWLRTGSCSLPVSVSG